MLRLSREKHPATTRMLLLSIALSLASLTAANALTVNERVENFRLSDHLGRSHELYYHSNAKAIAVMVQGNGCPIVRNAMPGFKALRDQFAAQGVQFLLLNSNLQDNRTSIAAEAEKYAYDIPILVDDTQLIGEALGLVRTGEVFVIDPQNWTIVYQGAMDDRLTYENQKPAATAHYLADALQQMVDGKAIAVASTEPVGCLINFPEQHAQAKHADISYSDDIAPILLDNCVSCHRPGGIGPWAMTDYNMVRGFAPMIREVIRTQRMPPWHADPSVGHWSNDRSLTPAQRKTLVHWIEAGTPRGEGDDLLASTERTYYKWDTQAFLGAPDAIIDIPATEVPATGTVDYQYHHVANPIGKDVWIQAAEVLPGDRAVLHHTITAFGEIIQEGRHKGRFDYQGGLRGYAPGITNQPFPAGTGVFLPADATLEFQMHYTTAGRSTVDASKMGLWFHTEPPQHAIVTMFVLNTRIRIPAHANNHKETVTQVIPKDALLYNLMPHAHFRGKAAEFRAVYPDGTEQLLLSVPNYDFNWQTTYELAEPLFLPAGTKLVQANWWDNSAQNKANPDPSIEVRWGEQSWEEMLFGAVSLRFLDATEAAQIKQAAQTKARADTALISRR
ncbi:MAG: redoxin domain-containing protein [Pseudomonadota bacterium]